MGDKYTRGRKNSRMKAITIWQPWASLLACGTKKYETRSRPTSYRGPIAIWASTKKPSTINDYDFISVAYYPLFHDVHDEITLRAAWSYEINDLPRGCILATAELIDCYSVDEKFISKLSKKEKVLGNFEPGIFAWELANIKMLPEPIPAKGKQGLWNWEPPEK